PNDIRETIKISKARRTKEQAEKLREYYLANIYAPARSTFEPILKEIAGIRKQRDDLDNSVASTMVMHEMPLPKPAFILRRGEYDKRGDEAPRNVPKALPPLPALPSGVTNYTRLDLAKWLVSRDHPLTSRVAVNRL